MNRETTAEDTRSLKRALIDHMVTTMVAGVMSGFLFLVWHLYASLEKRVAEQERESAAALLVLKEQAISDKVRLDLLERAAATVAARPEPAAPAPTPVATVPAGSKAEPSFWSPPPAQQQQQQQQQQMPPPLIRQTPISEFEAARDELRKKISDLKPGSKP